MSGPALRLEGVTRRFGRKTAVDRLDLQVPEGVVVGLLGRNGAGKTTLLRLATGVLWPDEGRIRTLGLDPVTHGLEVRARASLLAEESALYPWMTVGQIVSFAAAISATWDAALARDLVRRLDLDEKQKIKTLSRGTRAKVSLLLAVATRPSLLLLDDPTSGLDPLVRREVLETLLETVVGEGGSVLYASHLIGDVERIADRVAVLDRGRLALEGGLEDMKARTARLTAVFAAAAAVPREIPGALDVRADGRILVVVSAEADAAETAIRALGPERLERERLPLEEILVAQLRGGKAGTTAQPLEEVLHG
jgi:ABC-2 type transport system ATP-binding protein